MTKLEIQATEARAASKRLAACSSAEKDAALTRISERLIENTAEILRANQEDMDAARAGGMRESLLDRLLLTEERIRSIAKGVLEVAALPDPVGRITSMGPTPGGLVVGRKSVPIGVIGMIYEARPNVTVDAAILCMKAGNSVILRGGKDAANSSRAFVRVMRSALEETGLPAACVSLVEDLTRDSAVEMMQLRGYIDLLIPRGSAGLIKSVVENAKVPVIETGWGNCHVYIDRSADLKMGAEIICNAKCSRPSVCNAAETLLVERSVAAQFLPMAKELMDKYGTQLRGCPETLEILGDGAVPATDEDYDTEYGDYILAIKIVSGLDEAIAHINTHGSGHSEAIVTSDYFAAQRFLEEVDAAAVYVNASTRFTDGGEFGLGAEIGISTQKLHARGPMGVEQLTSVKYIAYGTGQIR